MWVNGGKTILLRTRQMLAITNELRLAQAEVIQRLLLLVFLLHKQCALVKSLLRCDELHLVQFTISSCYIRVDTLHARNLGRLTQAGCFW